MTHTPISHCAGAVADNCFRGRIRKDMLHNSFFRTSPSLQLPGPFFYYFISLGTVSPLVSIILCPCFPRHTCFLCFCFFWEVFLTECHHVMPNQQLRRRQHTSFFLTKYSFCLLLLFPSYHTLGENKLVVRHLLHA